MHTLQKKLDSFIQNKINIKSYAESAWNLAKKPVFLNNEKNLWLMSELSSLYVTPLFTKDNAAQLGVGLKGKFSINLGEVDQTDRQLNPLPELQSELPPSGFSLSVPISIDYPELEKQVNNKLKDYQIDYEGNHIKTEKITIFGSSSGKFVFGAKVNIKSKSDWFGTNGWIY